MDCLLELGHIINALALNNFSQGIITAKFFNYVALVSPTGVLTPLSGLPVLTTINSVAINNSPLGFIGGVDNAGAVVVAFVSPTGVATPVNGLSPMIEIVTVAINDLGQGLIGGVDNTGPAYAAFVSLPNVVTPVNGLAPIGSINSVAINNFGQGLIGGNENNGALSVFVSPSNTVITLTGLPQGSSNITSVGSMIRDKGIIGGQDASRIPIVAYAALVSPSGIATALQGLPSLNNSSINSVAINHFGQGLIRGTKRDSSLCSSCVVCRRGYPFKHRIFNRADQ